MAVIDYRFTNPEGERRLFRVSDIKQFIELATCLYSSTDVIFRGQTEDWPLLPAVARSPISQTNVNIEDQLISEFKREGIPHLDFAPQNDWQWLAVAQHNGLPTRLLDWTRNPLVALWFTVSQPPSENKPGIVWAYWFEPSEALYSTNPIISSPFEISRTYVFFPDHVYHFIQAQAACFTVHYRIEESSRFALFTDTADADLRLTKIEIDPDAFCSIRYNLFQIGIHSASLFPGLRGLSDRIRYDRLEDDNTLPQRIPKEST